MLSERIRSWRWWPALPLAALIATILAGSMSPPQQNNAADVSHSNTQTLQISAPMGEAQREANATETIARFTVVLAIVGMVQGAFIGWQLRLANKEFVASHRPVLKVRQLDLTMFAGNPFRIRYMAVNTGASRATILEQNARFIYMRPGNFPEGVLLCAPSTAVRQEIKIANGGFCLIDIFDPESEEDNGMIQDIRDGRRRLFVHGYIAYADDLGVIRRTGFYRWYNINNRRFSAVDDAEYEYTD